MTARGSSLRAARSEIGRPAERRPLAPRCFIPGSRGLSGGPSSRPACPTSSRRSPRTSTMTPTGSIPLTGQYSLEGELTISDPTLRFANVTYGDSTVTGTVAISAASGGLAFGSAATATLSGTPAGDGSATPFALTYTLGGLGRRRRLVLGHQRDLRRDHRQGPHGPRRRGEPLVRPGGHRVDLEALARHRRCLGHRRTAGQCRGHTHRPRRHRHRPDRHRRRPRRRGVDARQLRRDRRRQGHLRETSRSGATARSWARSAWRPPRSRSSPARPASRRR